ncbi:MAG TPA: diguanylate cyclase, partial [Pseudomonadales bacterium]|nr:diguanylate cyclase [Pseudomonadales bacterium]
KVAETLASIEKRPMDLIARYGGEEFVVLLPGMSWQRAKEFAERARQMVMDLGIEHQASAVSDRVTVSIGVAVLQPERSMKSDLLIQIADNALYQAKREGRNRVCGPTSQAERV